MEAKKPLYETYDVKQLLRLAKEGDSAAQDRLVESNVGLVWSSVKRFHNRGHEAEDLFQIGCIGLIKAIQKFDESYDVKFSTYAVPMIIGEIKRFIRDDGIIKVSRSLKELSVKAMTVKEMLMRETGEEPTVHEIARQLDVSPEELATALEAGTRPESLYYRTDDGTQEGKALIDKLENPKDYESNIINKVILKDAIESFGEREQKIILLRYFKQNTQAQIAEMLGISQVQVSRLEKKILLQLREKIAGKQEHNAL